MNAWNRTSEARPPTSGYYLIYNDVDKENKDHLWMDICYYDGDKWDDLSYDTGRPPDYWMELPPFPPGK